MYGQYLQIAYVEETVSLATKSCYADRQSVQRLERKKSCVIIQDVGVLHSQISIG